jgi:phage terminase large subunit GpA-like protein
MTKRPARSSKPEPEILDEATLDGGFDEWELEALALPPAENIIEWAERNIVLSRSTGTPRPGPISLDVTPYLREPLLAATDPDVEEITLVFSTQVGKTMALVLTVLYYTFRDPWNTIFAMPRERDAEDLCTERFHSIIRESPALASYLTGAKKDLVKDAVRLNGVTARFVGAHSPAALASRGARVVATDELDKWPIWSGGEADPLKLVKERMVNFDESKLIKCSTPKFSNGYILSELEQSTNCRYHVPCPLCGKYQELVMGGKGAGTPGVKWPEGERDPERILSDRLAWYECAHCHGSIVEENRLAMVRRGVWVHEGGTVDDAGKVQGSPKSRRHVGYHLWAVYSFSPKRTFHHIAAEFLRSKDHPPAWMNFKNSWLAEGWTQEINELQWSDLRGKCSEYVQGRLPLGAWVITVGVDVQSQKGDTYLYYVMRAWGAEEESWLVKAGRLESWDALTATVQRSNYRDARGDIVPVGPVYVDAGFNSAEVYDYCAATRSWAIKGNTTTGKHFTLSRSKAGGRRVNLIILDANHYKTMLHRLIRSDHWHLPGDIEEEYFRQMTAEQLMQVTEKGTGRTAYKWQVRSMGAANHYFDCEVYATAAADINGLRNQSIQPVPPAPQPDGGALRRPRRKGIYSE